MKNQIQCPGAYSEALRDRDNIVRNSGNGAWATGTCPDCGCRVGVMRPTSRRTMLEFSKHTISPARYAMWSGRDAEAAVIEILASGPLVQAKLF